MNFSFPFDSEHSHIHKHKGNNWLTFVFYAMQNACDVSSMEMGFKLTGKKGNFKHKHTDTKQQSNKIDKHGYRQNAEIVEK